MTIDEANQFVGMKIKRDRASGILDYQSDYVESTQL